MGFPKEPLIEPCGIETQNRGAHGKPRSQPLIEPCGIETLVAPLGFVQFQCL